MSNEKNLVTYNKHLGKNVVNADEDYDYQYITTAIPNVPHSIERHCYAFGPAIDRLHEFEKLGMEPEEIVQLLKINTDNIRYLNK